MWKRKSVVEEECGRVWKRKSVVSVEEEEGGRVRVWWRESGGDE